MSVSVSCHILTPKNPVSHCHHSDGCCRGGRWVKPQDCARGERRRFCDHRIGHPAQRRVRSALNHSQFRNNPRFSPLLSLPVSVEFILEPTTPFPLPSLTHALTPPLHVAPGTLETVFVFCWCGSRFTEIPGALAGTLSTHEMFPRSTSCKFKLHTLLSPISRFLISWLLVEGVWFWWWMVRQG